MEGLEIMIYLIRHGEVEYPRDELGRKLVYGPNTSLSALGRQQEKALGQKLKEGKVKIKALFTSPYLRAKESAQIIQEELSIAEMHIIDGLRDVDNPDWIGIPLEEYGKTGGDIYAHSTSDRQETLEKLINRGKEAIRKILEIAGDRTVGIVSHGDSTSALVWALTHPEGSFPTSYNEMKENFYLKKGEGWEFEIDESIRLRGEGKFITVEEVHASIETWR